jgi:hypothetical protein
MIQVRGLIQVVPLAHGVCGALMAGTGGGPWRSFGRLLAHRRRAGQGGAGPPGPPTTSGVPHVHPALPGNVQEAHPVRCGLDMVVSCCSGSGAEASGRRVGPSPVWLPSGRSVAGKASSVLFRQWGRKAVFTGETASPPAPTFRTPTAHLPTMGLSFQAHPSAACGCGHVVADPIRAAGCMCGSRAWPPRRHGWS